MLAAVGTLAVSWPAHARKAAPLPRVAVVMSATGAAGAARLAAFRQGMRERGYEDGRNVTIDVRSWHGDARPLPDLAADVVRSGPAVIVVEGNPPLAALKRATSSIPIVMAVVGDPVGSGFVASLARPGGNVTGLSNAAEQLSGKRVELLKELVPGMKRVGVLRNPANATHPIFLRETQAATHALGIEVIVVDLGSTADVEGAFRALARDLAQAAIVLPQPLVGGVSRQFAEASLRHRVPAMFHTPEPVEAGGLVSYGPDSADLWRRTADYVDRIVRGARPADLPVEQPTHFDLIVNRGAARTLGIVIPASVLSRAPKFVE